MQTRAIVARVREIGRKLLQTTARRLANFQRARVVREEPAAYLDAVLRSPSGRALSRVLSWRERRKAARSTEKRLPDLSALSPNERERALVSELLLRAPTLRAKLDLLEDVFTRGGYDTAQALTDVLETDVVRAPRALRQRALPLFTRIWLTNGAAERAQSLWQRAGSDLSPDHPWRQALLLSLGALDEPRWRAGPRCYPYPAAVCIERGQLRSEQIYEQMAASPWTVLINPELDLLLHNALLHERRSELSAFNRYLERHALPRAHLRSETPIWLGGLAFGAAPLARGPLVSVIMSARNAERTITYAVDSILRQTHEPLELLVADDASDDATLHILRERYSADGRVRLFRSVQNQGTYNVRNQLIAEARGEYVTFQDADDVSLPTRLSRQVHAIRAARGVACVSEWLRIRPDGSVAFFSNGRAARLSIVSLMVSRRVLLELGRYPSARVGADLDMYRRVLSAYGGARVTRLPTPLLLGLWSEGSLTRSQLTESLESGYRSPVRRRYSELVFRRDLFGLHSLPDGLLSTELQRMGNYIAPSELTSDLSCLGL